MGGWCGGGGGGGGWPVVEEGGVAGEEGGGGGPVGSFAAVPELPEDGSYHELSFGVRGATVARTAVGQVVQLRFPLPAPPFDTAIDYMGGPGSHENLYGQHRQFFPVRGPERPGVVWQDKRDGEVWVTWLSDSEPSRHRTAPIASVEGGGVVLAAATSDPEGALYYLLIQEGDGRPFEARRTWLVATEPDGSERQREELDATAEGLNMVEFGWLQEARFHAVLRWSDGNLGLMLARTMTQSGDGLNHQGGIAAVFHAGTLTLLRNHGQTSGHSFVNVLEVQESGGFVGLDLGDNYPRGVHLHRFGANSIASRVVYTFKTLHGTTPESPAGVTYDPYEEISSEQVPFYQWSNDNGTYTELGGLAATERGLTVVFATERSGLDNAAAGALLNDQRDVALLLVRSDFELAPRGEGSNVVTDELIVAGGDGPVEEGGFYGFNGGWHPQRNVAPVWLTSYPDSSRNASRVKLHRLTDERLLVLWETWDPHAYRDTRAVIVAPDGDVLVPAVSLGGRVRLGWRDDLLPMAAGVASLGGSARTSTLIVNLVLP